MKELAAPLTTPEAWTFRTREGGLSEVHRGPVNKDGTQVVFQVAAWREVTVVERMAFDATRKAAQLLGVAPDQLEMVYSPFQVTK